MQLLQKRFLERKKAGLLTHALAGIQSNRSMLDSSRFVECDAILWRSFPPHFDADDFSRDQRFYFLLLK